MARLHKALASGVNIHASYLELAACYVEQRRYEEALAATRRARALQESDAVLRVLADAQIGLGSYEQAQDTLSDLVVRHPEKAEYPLKLGKVQLKNAELENAADSFERAVRLDPDLLDARLELAKALAQLRSYDEAIATVEQGLARVPQAEQAGRAEQADTTLLLLQGRLYEQMNRAEDAGRIYDRLLEKRPHTPEALAGRGRVLRLTGQVDQSLQHLLPACKKHPGSAALLVELGLSYRDFGMEPKALEVLLQAVGIDPGRAGSVDPLLELMQKHNADRDAVFSVVGATAKALPDRFDLQLRFANGLLERKRYDEAIPPLQRALRILPSSVEANFSLGIAQARLGEFEAAATTVGVLRKLGAAEAKRLQAIIAAERDGEQAQTKSSAAETKSRRRDKRRKGRRKPRRTVRPRK
jgi:tetratricopeptide (TPR) repeat protein